MEYFCTKYPNDPPSAYKSSTLQLFLQISIICFLTVLSCIGYAYEGFFDEYKALVTATAYAYLFYLGSPAFVYLLLNKSIRRAVANLMIRLVAGNYVVHPETDTHSTNKKNTKTDSHWFRNSRIWYKSEFKSYTQIIKTV